ncbi:hypothetical protein FALBO_4333 [Fusarium albosuccineum]|uniref:Uncharacterized protein n=1 Tax=Fusarium albosuccineum TaxID=1237068 RepID=A0A8H4LIK8_9HYPO|nr:hypothetical protein FALBO_4333 [Fusarium albosuccineum]
MPSWFSSGNTGWILQPDVVIHSSIFDPLRAQPKLDRVLGSGSWYLELPALSDRYELYVKQPLSQDVVGMVNSIAAGDDIFYYQGY